MPSKLEAGIKAIPQAQPYGISTTVATPELPERAGALPERLQDIARNYLGARRQSGMSLLEAARWLSEARLEAVRGEWHIFLEAIGLDESRARAQIRIHEEAQRDPLFADRIVNGFLSEAVARELLPAPPEVREAVLARDEPPTLQDVREAKRALTPALEPAPPAPDLPDILKRLDAHGYAKTTTRQKGIATLYSFRDYSGRSDETGGEVELAEGELPIWLAELDSHAAYAQAKQERFLEAQARAARLGYELKRDGTYFTLSISGQAQPAMRGTLDAQIRAIEGYERNAAKQASEGVPHLPPDFADAQKRATKIGLFIAMDMHGTFSIKNAGGSGVDRIAAWDSLLKHLAYSEQAAAEIAAERSAQRVPMALAPAVAHDSTQLLISAVRGLVGDVELFTRQARVMVPTIDEEGCATLAAAIRALTRLIAPDAEPLAPPPVSVEGARAALIRANELAGDDLAALADQLDDASYEALAAFRRDRSVPALEATEPA